MIDRTVRHAAAVTIAVGSLLVAPFLAATAARSEHGAPVRTPHPRIIIVPSPVASILTLPPGQASRSDGNGHAHGRGHHRGGDHSGDGGD